MRLDKHLLEKKLAETRSKAVHLIKTGNVLVNEKLITKQAYKIKPADRVRLLSRFAYVSRGGYKIEKILKEIRLNCAGKRVLDVGCSTGGFSDVFLQKNAAKVVAVDIAKDVLHPSLQKHPRLRFFGGTDATKQEALKKALGPEKFNIISIDLSNVPLQAVLSKLSPFLEQKGMILALFKPQYQGGRGVVSSEKTRELMKRFEQTLRGSFKIIGVKPSPIRGGSKSKGNQEFIYILQKEQ